MEIMKFTLISNKIKFGLEPSPQEEVAQRLTFNSKGQVWFTGYKYNEPNGRKMRLHISKEIAGKLLILLSQYFEQYGQLPLVTDIGIWNAVIIDSSGKMIEFQGSLCSDYLPNGSTYLSEVIRMAFSIEDLFAFDGDPN